MIPLLSATSGGFTWTKLPRNRGREVRLNGIPSGTLRKTSVWSSKYEATTSEGTFTFRRNCWGSKTEILDSASQQRIALFESGWRKPRTLTFADGQRFHINRKGCWRPQWNVTTESGQLVLSLNMGDRTANASVSTVKDNRLSLMILFILYRVQQAEEEAAASAIVAAIVASSVS